jgi:hypothetical protein
MQGFRQIAHVSDKQSLASQLWNSRQAPYQLKDTTRPTSTCSIPWDETAGIKWEFKKGTESINFDRNSQQDTEDPISALQTASTLPADA